MIYVLQEDGSLSVRQSHTQVERHEEANCYAVIPLNPDVYTRVHIRQQPELFDAQHWLRTGDLKPTRDAQLEVRRVDEQSNKHPR